MNHDALNKRLHKLALRLPGRIFNFVPKPLQEYSGVCRLSLQSLLPEGLIEEVGKRKH